MLDKIIFEFLRKYTSHHRMILLRALLLSITQSLLLIPSLYFIKQIFDTSIPQNDTKGLLLNSSMIVLITIIQSLIGFIQKNAFLKVVKKAITLLQKDVMEHLIWANSRFYNETNDAKIINSVVSDVDKVDRMIDGFLAVVIPQLTLFVLGLSLMIVYNPIIGLSTLALGLSGVLIQRRFKKSMKKFIESYRTSIDHLAAYIGFLPKKQILTKLKNFESPELMSALNLSGRVINSGMAAARKGLKKQTIDELVINISAILLIVLGSFQILSDSASYGNIFGLYFLIVFIRRTAHSVQSQWTINQEGKVSLNRICQLLTSLESESYASIEGKTINYKGSLRAQNLSFGYTDELILVDVNFEIHSGEVVTISGANGSGKSSLVKLILGLYKPRSGSLFAGDVNYNDLNINQLRTQIGYVPQNQVLIDGTIESNLCYGIEANKTDLLSNIQNTILFHELMKGFEHGLKTPVSLEGKNLSNGQIQKISILRALFAQPKLLILDEPTNHLDAEAIKALIAAIKKELRVSILVISHHKLFDEISDKSYVLEHGHLNLMKSN